MGDIPIDIVVEKQVTETAVFSVDVPWASEDGSETGTIEVSVKVEDTDGTRFYSVSTDGDLDVMGHEEAHALFHMLDRALLWTSGEGS